MASIFKLILQIIGQDQASDDLRRVNKELRGVSSSADTMSKALVAAGGALGIAYMAKQAASAVWDLGELGAQSLELKDAFQDLAGAASDDLLRAIKDAAGGTVSEMDAMAAANKGILLGMGTDIEQWGKLTEVARFRARAMGIDVTQAISDIATGIGRESRMILDNLGIVLDLDEVMGNYAATLGKTAKELDAFERKQAIMNGIIEEGQSLMSGEIEENYADSFRELEAAIDDAKIALTEGFAPAVADAAEYLSSAIPELVAKFTLLNEAIKGNISLGDLFRIEMEADAAGLETAAERSAFYTKALADIQRERVAAAYAERDAAKERADALRTEIDAQKKLLATLDPALGMGYQLTQQKIERLEIELGLAEAIAGTMDATLTEVKAMKQLPPVAQEAARQLDNLTTALLVSSSAMEANRQGILGTTRAIWDYAFNIVEAAQSLAEPIWNALDPLEQEEWKNRATYAEDAAARAGRAWEDAYSDLRSTIERALQPTQVTALDMGLSDIGQYVDKWDENARRLDAIAERGFAELQAHADWAAVLKIPPEVLAAGEDALKSWAAQTSGEVRNLFRPDLLNIEGAVAAVQRALEQEAAKELSLDIITQAVMEKGLVSGEDAKKKIAAALGIDQTYIGEEAGAQFMSGIMTSLQDTSLSAEFASYMQKDVADSSGTLKNSGEALWQRVELGIMDAMLATPYALEFARILAPYVAKELQEQQERTVP